MKLRVSVLLLCLASLAPCLALAQSLTRGPYLQSGSTTAVTVRWRTSSAAGSIVKYGTSSGNLDQTATVSGSVANHIVPLTGLAPNTKYFYSVGHGTTVLASGTDTFFVTAPTAAKPTRIWVLGDAGTGSSAQAAVRDSYYSFTGPRHTDLVMMLGDNAYPDGTDSEHQAKLFNIYPTMLKKSVVWSTLGNHEGHTATSSTQSGPYYDIWTFPKQGEAGGVASGTEAYYSFDYGNIHFVCLDSYGTSRSATGAMANWLRNDLDNHTRPWLVTFFHHPPYSKGSHDSDSETELVQMRTNLVPILEEYGVDLILCGHSHAYERSKYIDGHYGTSGTFNAATHVVQTGSGREDDTGAYRKPAAGPVAGAVYTVAGSSGQTSGGTLNHPAHFISLNVLGSLVLDFDGNRLDAKMISNVGALRDYFTIIKDSAVPAAPGNLTPAAGNAQVALSWAASTGATSYNVKSATTSGGPYTLAGTSATTSFTHTGLTNGTTYYYVVTASNAQGEGPASLQVSATPTSAAPQTATFVAAKDANAKEKFPTTNYGADTIVQVSSEAGFRKRTFATFTVSGIPAGATNVTAQVKLRSQTTASGRAITTYAVADTSWGETTITWSNQPALGAALNTLSDYTAAQDSVWNVSAQVTGNGTYTIGVDTTFAGDTTFESKEGPTAPRLVVNYHSPGLPSTPTGLAADAGNTQIALTWNASAGATSYNIKSATTSGGPYTTIASPATPGFTHTGLTNGTTYYYVVSAVNSSGESANSAQASATPQSSVTVTFAPVKDSMVKEAAATTNFGTQTQLQVSAQTSFRKNMFLQFDVSGIPAGATLTSATLLIASQTTGTGRTVTAKVVSTTGWTETGITWNNKPAFGGNLSSVSSHTAGQDSAWDVAAHVVGNGSFALGLDSSFAGDTNFYSRESGAATAPELVIVYQP